MASTENDIMTLARNGSLSLADLGAMESTASASGVTIDDWGASYNTGTGQLSEFCTLTSSSPITGVGMLAYPSDGSSLYAAQYTNGFSSSMIATSIGTLSYKPQDGNQVLCVVYGWTDQASFYFTQQITVTVD